MPGGDGMGPAGMGPMTGRAAGYCAGYPTPGYTNPYGGRFGGGFGRGRGRFGGFPYAAPYSGMQQYDPYGGVPYSKEQEKESLQSQVKIMEDQLDAINKRIAEIETEASEGTE